MFFSITDADADFFFEIFRADILKFSPSFAC